MHDIYFRGQHILVDAAHNADGIRALLQAVQERNLKVKGAIFGVMKDKDTSKMLEVRQ